jgi:hypothetical protein
VVDRFDGVGDLSSRHIAVSLTEYPWNVLIRLSKSVFLLRKRLSCILFMHSSLNKRAIWPRTPNKIVVRMRRNILEI